jgi:replicative DNA helicase
VARREDRDEMANLRDLVDKAMLDLEQLQNRESAYTGIPTGFRDLDSLTSGFQPGNLIVIAARPGIGKSSFAVNIARNMSVENEPVAIFSLEMSRWEIGMRMLCAEARVPWDRIRNKRVGPNDWMAIVQAAETLHDAPLSIVDAGNTNIVDIRAKARRMRQGRKGLSMIIVDYLQLMGHPGSGSRRPDSRQQEIAEISRSLKLLAKELSIPVIAISQLNRNPETRADKRPQLSDLRECVTGDTLVSLADGRRARIDSLVGTTPEVLAMSPERRVVRAVSDKVWEVGVRPVFSVQVASGRRIRCTGRHRLFAAQGWTRVRDLAPGDRLAIARTVPEPREPVSWPDDRVALLGHLIGDGSYLRGQPMRYTTASEANSDLVTRAAAREFGARVSRHEGRGRWHQLVIADNGNRWKPAGVNAWLRKLSAFDQRSEDKRVPQAAFQLPNRQVALLLQHLWAADGSIHVRRDGLRGPPRVYFSTASELLAGDVAALLHRVGIVARIRRVSRAPSSRWFTVDVSGHQDQTRFLETVGAFGPRVEPAARLQEHLRRTRSNTNVDSLPGDVFAQVRDLMTERGVSQRAMAAMRGTSYGGSSHFSFEPSRGLIACYAQLLDDPELAKWTDGDLFWDRIVDIEPAGEESVYDLTVPGPANWLADALVSHNSGAIEQDADLVMFIHRDDADPEKKKRAELIVSKHRNGPTGSVELMFEPSLTQFRNAARNLEE